MASTKTSPGTPSPLPTAKEMIAVLKKPMSTQQKRALLIEIGLITPEGELTRRYTNWGKALSRTESSP